MLDKSHKFEKLIQNHLSGNISDSEEYSLLNILKSDKKYKILYKEMAKTRAISQIPVIESKKISNYKLLLQLLRKSLIPKRHFDFWKSIYRIAAIVIFFLSTSISIYYIYTSFKISSSRLMSFQTVVPRGSQAKIVLPDGTVAWLNSGSTLKYDNLFSEKVREVHLTGEGYFDVAKDKSKPFLVYINNIEIKVLGTVFNVRSYFDDSTVVVDLLKGKVDVTTINNEMNQKLTLVPNEKLVYNKSSKLMILSKVIASRSIQWTKGKLYFDNVSIKDIVKYLERKYDVQIKIESTKVQNEIFSGCLNLNQPLNEILDYIDVDKKLTTTHTEKLVLIKNK